MPNAVVSPASANVPTHPLLDLSFATRVAFLYARYGGHDLSWRAIAALETVVPDERGLHWMQIAPLRQPLYGRDAGSLSLNGQHETRVDAAVADEHGTGTALAVVAAFFGPCQFQPLAQRVQQRHTRLQLKTAVGTIDVQHYGFATVVGSQDYLRERYAMGADAIAKTVRAMLGAER